MKKVIVMLLAVYFVFFCVNGENVSAKMKFKVENNIEILEVENILSVFFDVVKSCMGIVLPPVDPPSVNLTQEVVRIVGDEGYCNKDSSGNYKSCSAAGIKTKLGCIAYSQIGYLEKASSKSLDSCKANPGSGNYQKYNNGYQWCDGFIRWTLNRAGLSRIQVPTNGTSLSKCDTSRLKEGDFVVYTGGGYHIAMVYRDTSNNLHVIHGNWGNAVVTNSGIGISGKTIKGCQYNNVSN